MATRRYMSNHELAYCSQYDAHSPMCQNCKCTYVDIEETIILQECRAFYTVFLQLEQQLQISGLQKDKIDDELPKLFFVPYLVNGAFACELALKYILITSNIAFNMGKGHDLAYLFQLLPQREKDTLTSLVEKENCLNGRTFLDCLNIIADTFNKQRYQFNNYNQDLSTHTLFKPFVHTVCRFVLEILDKSLADGL